MPAALNLEGQTFGMLRVLCKTGSKWMVKCICGSTKMVAAGKLNSGHTTSCGSCSRQTHGKTDTPTYSVWKGMIERTTSKTCKDYPRYGGSGIGVHPRWLHFEAFLRDMGEKPEGLTLERRDGTKGYGPGNCKWATTAEQSRNRKSNVLYTFEGKPKSWQTGPVKWVSPQATCRSV